MPVEAASENSLQTRILSLQTVTLVWMVLECSVALFAAWRARSVSLLAFGSDSFVEILSATVVLIQFTPRLHISQYRAARLCGALLYGLAGVVAGIAIVGLLRHSEADSSALGMAITAGALLVMPLLARMKRETAAQTGNKALRADAVQSATCAYLAGLTLAGLLLRRFLGVHWVDPLAALLAVPILTTEGKRARKGQTCACC
jgi:divalent metal cation (Fe/Co/Zn/Cd) transporter